VTIYVCENAYEKLAACRLVNENHDELTAFSELHTTTESLNPVAKLLTRQLHKNDARGPNCK
jgi:hypothetical protein